jgi:hypothetical protein
LQSDEENSDPAAGFQLFKIGNICTVELLLESSTTQGLLAVWEGAVLGIPVGHGFRLAVSMHRIAVTPIVDHDSHK